MVQSELAQLRAAVERAAGAKRVLPPRRPSRCQCNTREGLNQGTPSFRVVHTVPAGPAGLANEQVARRQAHLHTRAEVSLCRKRMAGPVLNLERSKYTKVIAAEYGGVWLVNAHARSAIRVQLIEQRADERRRCDNSIPPPRCLRASVSSRCAMRSGARPTSDRCGVGLLRRDRGSREQKPSGPEQLAHATCAQARAGVCQRFFEELAVIACVDPDDVERGVDHLVQRVVVSIWHQEDCLAANGFKAVAGPSLLVIAERLNFVSACDLEHTNVSDGFCSASRHRPACRIALHGVLASADRNTGLVGRA